MPKSTESDKRAAKDSSKVRSGKDRPEPRRHTARRMTGEELSRHEKETRLQRMLVLGVAGMLLLMVVILGFGWWRVYYSRGNDVVASAAGKDITLSQYARRLDSMRKGIENQIQSMQAQYAANSGSPLADLYKQQVQQLQFAQSLLPDQTLDQMIDEQLVRREAAKRGITVSSDEVDQEINKTFGDQPTPQPQPTSTAQPGATAAPSATPSPAATPGPSPTPVPTQDVQANVSNVLLNYGFTRDEFRSIIEYEVMYRKLSDAMGAEVPTTAEEVHVRHILVDTEDKAKEILTRLKAGEKFEDVAKAESKDDGTKDKGGDLGWFPKGKMVPEFDTAAFQLPVNQLSDPVKSTYGYHIIQVLEKDPNRPLTKDELDQAKSEAVTNWLSQARTAPEVKRNLSDDEKQWVYDKIKWTPPPLGG